MIKAEVSVIGMDDEVPAGRVVVVLDVIRAFTTAAIAFERGATEIVCAGTADAARALRAVLPECLVIGEQGGLKPADFDLGNSPLEMSTAAVGGRRLIQATSNGTRGLARSRHATAVLAASAVNAGATARWILEHHGDTPVAILCTGRSAEDWACADYLRGLLRGTDPQSSELVAGIRAGAAEHARRMAEYPVEERVHLTQDLPFCCEVDRAGFAMVGLVEAETVRLRAVPA